MNLRQIEVFYAVMQTGTVSGAAKQLHVSQPNVTRVLAHTEQQLGFTLFERIKGRLIPTQEAQFLIAEAEKIYQQLGQFRRLTSKLKHGQYHLRIGAPPILASGFLSPVIAQVCMYTDYTLEVCTANRDELIEGLVKNEWDLAICFGEETASPIVQSTLYNTEMKALLPTGTCENTSVTLADLLESSLPLVTLDTRDPLGIQLHQSILATSPSFHPKISVRSYNVAAEMVVHGAANAVVDPWTAQHYQFNPQVHCASLTPAIPVTVSLLYCQHSPLSVSAKWFAEQLKKDTI
ncbi:LysR family transcriptional regulator [Vibrio sp. Isolate23]|uniref:LysR family transcriptional regulator n=1 Tax=Vibrio sp. Isolate23 TaxID=2908533 RepID=UPI001EFCAA85|nr:LysR family transcriptional regulator [Vibrio sp. Isolate23]